MNDKKSISPGGRFRAAIEEERPLQIAGAVNAYCAHRPGKAIVSQEEMADRIKSAVQQRLPRP